MKRRHRKLARREPGTSPGTLTYRGEQLVDRAGVQVTAYDSDRINDVEVQEIGQISWFREQFPVTWVNLAGLHDTALLERLGTAFGLHPLLMEDVLNTEHRPKLEFYPEHLFFVVKMLRWDPEQDDIQWEQLSLVLGKGWLITFQERPGDVFDPVRKRLQATGRNLRKAGADYLFYALLDAVVDHYFLVLERVGERLENLESEVLTRPDQSTLRSIQGVKSRLIQLRRTAWPLREAFSGLVREQGLIQAPTQVFFRDVYDHSVHVMDTIESYLQTSGSLLDIYLSTVSNRMNEVMKVLTMIATIFIPLTFIAGIYGMNFEHMPELRMVWAYPAVWTVMVGLAGIMLYLFRRKGWL
jgi:magnesium transporter